MKNSTIELNWEPIQRYTDWKYSKDVIPGIYIWGFMSNTIFIPYYVGQAEDIYERLAIHAGNILGGLYCIFDEKTLLNTEDYNKIGKKFDSDKAIYAPEKPLKIKDFFDNRKIYFRHFKFMFEGMYFTCARQEKSIEKTMAEKLVILQIGKNNLINTQAGNTKNYL